MKTPAVEEPRQEVPISRIAVTIYRRRCHRAQRGERKQYADSDGRDVDGILTVLGVSRTNILRCRHSWFVSASRNFILHKFEIAGLTADLIAKLGQCSKLALKVVTPVGCCPGPHQPESLKVRCKSSEIVMWKQSPRLAPCLIYLWLAIGIRPVYLLVHR